VQSSSQGGGGSAAGVRRLSSPRSGLHHRQSTGPSVTRRLLYGALALVLASIITPLVCLAAGLARTRLARYLERLPLTRLALGACSARRTRDGTGSQSFCDPATQ